MIASAGACHIKQMPLGVVHVLKVGVIGYGFYPCLKRDDLVVASHDYDGSKFETFGEVHGGNANLVTDRFDAIVEDLITPHPPSAARARLESNFLSGAQVHLFQVVHAQDLLHRGGVGDDDLVVGVEPALIALGLEDANHAVADAVHLDRWPSPQAKSSPKRFLAVAGPIIATRAIASASASAIARPRVTLKSRMPR